jgi:hypothetical protein
MLGQMLTVSIPTLKDEMMLRMQALSHLVQEFVKHVLFSRQVIFCQYDELKALQQPTQSSKKVSLEYSSLNKNKYNDNKNDSKNESQSDLLKLELLCPSSINIKNDDPDESESDTQQSDSDSSNKMKDATSAQRARNRKQSKCALLGVQSLNAINGLLHDVNELLLTMKQNVCGVLIGIESTGSTMQEAYYIQFAHASPCSQSISSKTDMDPNRSSQPDTPNTSVHDSSFDFIKQRRYLDDCTRHFLRQFVMHCPDMFSPRCRAFQGKVSVTVCSKHVSVDKACTALDVVDVTNSFRKYEHSLRIPFAPITSSSSSISSSTSVFLASPFTIRLQASPKPSKSTLSQCKLPPELDQVFSFKRVPSLKLSSQSTSNHQLDNKPTTGLIRNSLHNQGADNKVFKRQFIKPCSFNKSSSMASSLVKSIDITPSLLHSDDSNLARGSCELKEFKSQPLENEPLQTLLSILDPSLHSGMHSNTLCRRDDPDYTIGASITINHAKQHLSLQLLEPFQDHSSNSSNTDLIRKQLNSSTDTNKSDLKLELLRSLNTDDCCLPMDVSSKVSTNTSHAYSVSSSNIHDNSQSVLDHGQQYDQPSILSSSSPSSFVWYRHHKPIRALRGPHK